MATSASELRFGSLSTYSYPSGSYDANKLGLSSLMVQRNGSTAIDKFCGPMPVAIGRPVETAGAIPGTMPWVLNWSATKSWVFLADNAAVAATRRIQLFELDIPTWSMTWKGYITVSFPFAGTQGTYTVRAFRMVYDTYTVGTVSGSAGSPTITGSSTAWATSRLVPGSRIGFGSTDPTAITTWYSISAVSETSITLTTNLATAVSAGSSYVIEDLRAVQVVTNGTTVTNGGVFLTKGLAYENFSVAGTAIAAAVSTDNVARTNYWLGDASTSTNTTAFGAGLQDKTNWQTQYLWVGDTVANPILFKYNLRAALTLATGKDVTSFALKTGSGGAVTGTTSQNNNGRIATASHGPGSGIPCFYFTTTTRVYRTVNVDNITTLSTSWLSSGDVMIEIPPGSTTTYAVTGALNTIEYASIIDKFFILSTHLAATHSYVTTYKTDSGQLDRIFLYDTRQLNQSTADSNAGICPNTLSLVSNIWSEGGIAVLCTQGTTAATNFIYAFPCGADWEYTSVSNQRIISPQIVTANCNKYNRVYLNEVSVIGGATGKNLGVTAEPSRVYYRTSGITDNTGSWALLDDLGDISGVAGSNSIQFMFEFRTIGLTCVPSRLLSLCVVYEDLSTDSHYQPSVAFSDITNKRFAWRFGTAFGGTVPGLRIRLYNSATNGLLIDDNTAAPSGTFEKSTDNGGSWGAYNTTDKANDNTYIRYTPASLGDNIKVKAMLTLA
jgi:hypothetical protein